MVASLYGMHREELSQLNASHLFLVEDHPPIVTSEHPLQRKSVGMLELQLFHRYESHDYPSSHLSSEHSLDINRCVVTLFKGNPFYLLVCYLTGQQASLQGHRERDNIRSMSRLKNNSADRGKDQITMGSKNIR